MLLSGFVNLGKSEKQRKLWPIFLKKKKRERKEKKKILPLHFRIISKDMLRIVKEFAPWVFI